MTKISLFQTFGTGWYLGSGETPLVTAAFVVVVEPDVPVVRGFFLNFLLTRKNIAARIIPRIHNAIKPTNKSLVVDQPSVDFIRSGFSSLFIRRWTKTVSGSEYILSVRVSQVKWKEKKRKKRESVFIIDLIFRFI